MWCTFYVLYRDGIRLPAETAKSSGVTGWLYMTSNNPGQGEPLRYTFLLPPADACLTRSIITPVKHSSLRAIMGGGMRLAGEEPAPSAAGGLIISPGGWFHANSRAGAPTLLRPPASAAASRSSASSQGRRRATRWWKCQRAFLPCATLRAAGCTLAAGQWRRCARQRRFDIAQLNTRQGDLALESA